MMKRLFTLFLLVILCFGGSEVNLDASASVLELGDVGSDGYVDNLDAVYILMYDAGISDMSDAQLVVADVNSDDSVDNLDALYILLYDAGINDTVTGKEPEPQVCDHNSVVIVNRVDATIESDGYSGDEYCNDCQKTIKKGIVLEKFTGISYPVKYYTYYKDENTFVTLPEGVNVFEYTIKRANKSAVSLYQELEEEILRLVNIEREKAGVAPLKNCANAYYYSNIRANECVELFSHTRPNGESCFTVFDDGDVFCSKAGENLFWCSGYPYESLAEISVDGWMNSEGHRANILNPNFTYSTIGVSYDPQTTEFYAVQLFMA